MPKITLRDAHIRSYMYFMLSRNTVSPTTDLQELARRASLDAATLLALTQIRYLQPRIPVPKAGNLHLAFLYASIPSEEHRFTQMLRITPGAFYHVLSLIQNHAIFTSRAPRPQAPVEIQLAVTLYRAGRYGNGASVEDVARIAGISEGSVLKYSERCMKAIMSLESEAIRQLTEEEKETEKCWVEQQVGCPAFRDGWCTGDGTLVRLHQKPGLNGDAYFSRKMSYDLNVQVVNTFTNLRIVDYVTGFTGSAHDSNAFQYSAVTQHPNWFFGSNNHEFMWADSAYTVTSRVIPVHKRPAADDPLNRQFDMAVSHIRIRSEHCMGAIKGRFQSLRGLRIRINRKRDHVDACEWIRMCLILHNLVIDIEGEDWAAYYRAQLPHEEYAHANLARGDAGLPDVTVSGEARRRQLVAEYASYRDEVRRSRI